MIHPFKYIGLSIGITFVFSSFLLYGRRQDIYQISLICGFLITLIFFLIILLGKSQFKVKVFWTIVIILCIIAQRLTEPFFIDTSYRIYINQNKNVLTEINNILVTKQGDITILNENITKGDQLTTFEINRLRDGRKKLGVYIISKSNNRIYYGLWGLLDVRLGILYWIEKNKPDKKYRHLTGKWFL